MSLRCVRLLSFSRNGVDDELAFCKPGVVSALWQDQRDDGKDSRGRVADDAASHQPSASALPPFVVNRSLANLPLAPDTRELPLASEALGRHRPARRRSRLCAARSRHGSRAAYRQRRVRPACSGRFVSSNSSCCRTSLTIVDGRHPTVEHSLKMQGRPFTSNSVHFSHPGAYIHCLTGPNMAGKSTFL